MRVGEEGVAEEETGAVTATGTAALGGAACVCAKAKLPIPRDNTSGHTTTHFVIDVLQALQFKRDIQPYINEAAFTRRMSKLTTVTVLPFSPQTTSSPTVGVLPWRVAQAPKRVPHSSRHHAMRGVHTAEHGVPDEPSLL